MTWDGHLHNLHIAMQCNALGTGVQVATIPLVDGWLGYCATLSSEYKELGGVTRYDTSIIAPFMTNLSAKLPIVPGLRGYLGWTPSSYPHHDNNNCCRVWYHTKHQVMHCRVKRQEPGHEM